MSVFVSKNGEAWEPSQEQIITWQRAYPDVDCYREIDAAACWHDAAPGTKKKTLKGFSRFVNSWLKRVQDSGGASPWARPVTESKATRDMTMDDMMSRDWAN